MHHFRAFGLVIASEARIPGLLESKATPAPDVQLFLGLPPELPSCPEVLDVNSYQRRVLRYAPELLGVSYPDGMTFVFDRAAQHVWVDWGSPYTIEDMAVYFQGQILSNLLHLREATPLHGSCVDLGGRAAAFIGPSGFGKSTTAAALAECGYRVITEDVIVADPFAGGYRVRPGYPFIRLWQESADLLLGEQQSLRPLTPNRTKLGYPLRSAFTAEAVPLTRIYLLGPREKGSGAPRVEPVSRRESLLELMRNRYLASPLEAHMEAGDFQRISRLTEKIPCTRLMASEDSARLAAFCALVLEDFRRR